MFIYDLVGFFIVFLPHLLLQEDLLLSPPVLNWHKIGRLLRVLERLRERGASGLEVVLRRLGVLSFVQDLLVALYNSVQLLILV
jgi:hypothetical protein